MTQYIGALIITGLCISVQATSIAPSADAWVSDTEPDVNRGDNIELRVGYSAANTRQNRGLMKFDLSSFTGTTVTNAKLHLYVASGGRALDLGLYAVADDTWSETTTTWNNQPSFGGLVDYNGPVAGGWVEIDVTTAVANTVADVSDDLWSVMLKSASESTDGSNVASFRSKEAAGFEPYLEISGLTPPSQTTTIDPDADVWVLANTSDPSMYDDMNHGYNIELRVGADAAQTRDSRSFLKFDLSGFDSRVTITSAKLHLYAENGNAGMNLGLYEVADDTWTETGLTWNNQPGSGGLLSTHGAVAGASWLTMDVTASVVAAFELDGLWSAMLKDIDGNLAEYRQISIHSKERTLRPYLEITMLSPFAADPTPADGFGNAETTTSFGWTAGYGALSHNVNMGTDPGAMARVASGSTTTTYTPADPLVFGQTYYWQIEEVAAAETVIGPTWSFTVAEMPTIYHMDLHYTSSLPADQRYDVRHVATCLQGLANREAPRIFLTFPFQDDLAWLDRLRESGGLCEGWDLQKIGSMEEYLSLFAKYAAGVVLYDADPDTGVISSSLVATTVAGVENGIAVRKDETPGSMYNYLVNDVDGPQLPVLVDLTGRFTGSGTIWQTSMPSTGSAKCDAYLWAIEKYIDAGKCNTKELSYSMDLWGLGLGIDRHAQLRVLDYAVSKKAFCFNLSPWGDEIPNDDSGQPLGTDLSTFIEILDHCNVQNGTNDMIHVCGFPNWKSKYTTEVGGSHDPIPTEWEFMRLLSAYNGYTDVETGSSSTSFYSALAPAVEQRRYVQNAPPSYADMVADGLIDGSGNVVPGNYVCMVMGDYDSPAWVLERLSGSSGIFGQESRGQVNCNWGVNPNLIDKVSVAMHYMYRNKTGKDYFAAWDSGSGYVNPGQFYGSRQSGYPSIVPAWQELCRGYYRQMDYSITGWILNGYQALTSYDAEVYSVFSGDGIGFHFTGGSSPDLALVDNTPVKVISGSGSIEAQFSMMNNPTGVNFAWYRAVNWNIGTQADPVYIPWGPDHVKMVEDQYATSGNNHRFLDVYTYYYLMRYYLGGNNDYRATWVSDTIPRIMAAGQIYPVTVTVRNDGWDTWSTADFYRLGCGLALSGDAIGYSIRTSLPGGTSIASGQSAVFSFDITAPSTSGNYDVGYDMVREGVTWFQSKNNIEWEKEIIVATNEIDIDTDGDGIPDVVEEEQLGVLYWHPDSWIADADGDGMHDAWEFQYFDGINAANGGAAADWDLDGFDNLSEYVAGTVPTNGNSIFKLAGAESIPAGFVLDWVSVSGRVYGVGWADSLTNGFELLPPTEIYYPVNSYTDTVHGAESKGFYRLDVRLEP